VEAIGGTHAYDRCVSLPVTRMPPTSRFVDGPARDATGSNRFSFRPVPAGLALAFCAAGVAANPQGGVVQAGSATITSNGNRLDVIQSSPRAIINWRTFSIGKDGQVNFQQPSTASATLNRVTGPEMSAILGGLTANGTVFIVNPNGILIGAGAKVDVGGLVAATANISNENFMAGRYKFDEVVNRDAVIINRGEITARAGGLVALVAPGVENSGVIRAELGRVVLASGNRFTLDLFGDKLITFAVDDKVAARLTDIEGRPLKAYVNQTGTIVADGGSVLIAASAAKAVLDNVINTSGVVRATSFVQRGGEIVLHGGDEGVVRVAGTLDASGRVSGASGGSVKVLGAEVVLDAGSRIDVAGDAGGGTALIGGGIQGGGGATRSARTAIDAGATVNADALTRGNGGTIVAWSDGETRFAGALSARGGAAGGDGGFVEVSGKRELAFNGAVDVAAPAGKGGRLLLDPESLIVDAATATTVAGVLRSGADATLAATDTVDVRQPIDGRGGVAGGGLTVNAGNAIAVNNDIVTNDGPVFLNAGAGGITMTGGPSTSVTGGQGTVIATGKAEITLKAVGDVTAQHLIATDQVSVTSTGGGTITLAGPIVARGNVTIGDKDRAGTTIIRLQNDVHTQNGDVELNGTTLVNPAPGERGLGFLSLKPLLAKNDGLYYDNPFVQVSVQTTGAGNVLFRGDVLWDYTRVPINSIHYLWGADQPSVALRESGSRPTGYFGLNVGVQSGTVTVNGNLGSYKLRCGDLACRTNIDWPDRDRLGNENPANGMWVTVNTNEGRLKSTLKFGADSKVAVSGLRVANWTKPEFDFLSGNSLRSSLGLPAANVVFLTRSLPRLTGPTGKDPGTIGPGPTNVLAAGTADRVAALTELQMLPEPPPPEPPVTPAAAAGVERTVRASDAAGTQSAVAAEAKRGSPVTSAMESEAGEATPLVRFAGSPTPGADAEYFSQGAVEFAETRSRRAGPEQ
jgi:filamentous hemagglutinin family protein